jgi:hypothetical protein
MDRKSTLDTFRARLEEVVRRSGLPRGEFAASAGVDRSTLSQLLSPSNRRLPRTETLVAISDAHQVSIDYLLGLSNTGPMQAEMIHEQMAFAPFTKTESDVRLLEWFAEAVGYKVRYVPSTIPDLLKTETVIRFELADYVSTSPAQFMESASARLEWTRGPETEMECCSSVQSVRSLARGEGVWSGLGATQRLAQLDQMIDLTGELYPTFRWFLFDGLQRYCAPVTIFGPLRAALYIGQLYLVLTSTEHVRTLSRHFDDLIRGAVVQPPDVPTFLQRLRREVRR